MSGRLGKASLTANTDTDVYTAPASSIAAITVSFCNRATTSAKVRLAIRDGALANGDYLEYDSDVPGNGVLERTKIVVQAGETVTVRADSSNVSVRVHGFEEIGS